MSSIALLLVGVLSGGLCVWAWSALKQSKAKAVVRRAAARGYAGELAAAQLLKAAGYRVTEAQPSATYDYWIDQEPHTAEMCPDYLAERDGETFVVEVKTGRGRRPTSRGTRRQLLEYATYFGADAALLVDAESEQIYVVDFPDAAVASSSPGRLGFALLGLAIGAVAGWLVHAPH